MQIQKLLYLISNNFLTPYSATRRPIKTQWSGVNRATLKKWRTWIPDKRKTQFTLGHL